MEKKTFIASGCSFTFEPWNWPTFVAQEFDMHLINVGMASQGNGLIAKKAIYKVQELLNQGYKNENIIVGIMWSGIDRYEIYDEKSKPLNNTDGWIENPTSITGNADDRNWVILNYGWKTDKARQWYGNLHSHIGAVIHTFEQILLTQWFLERNNINYFMTTFMDIFGKIPKDTMLNPDVKYLFDMIDFTKFLPVDGENEWLIEHYPVVGVPIKDGIHPYEFGHKMFAKEVISPIVNTFFDDFRRKLL